MLLALGLTLVACGGDDAPSEPLAIPAGCNPIASEHHCLLPYPSDVFLVDGRVTIPGEAQLRTKDGKAVDPTALHPADGFSPGNQILALFPQGFDDTPLAGLDGDAGASLEGASPTVLLDVETGERVLHLAEVDPRATEDGRRALLIRPLERLRDSARYVVAIRGLYDRQGAPLAAPAAFARLRDKGDTRQPELEALGLRYDADVFAPLEAAGVVRSELQLAWDFTVRSRDNATADLIAVRQAIIDAFANSPPEVEVTSVEDAPEEHQYRRLEATMTVPLFLEHPDPGAALVRDGDGKVAQNGTVEVPFTVIVPDSVATRPPETLPTRLLQFGHGFFGGRGEIHSFIDELADERQFVVVAADWWGMTAEDRNAVVDRLVNDTSSTMRFTDRVHQGMANFMALAYAAQGTLPDLPELAVGTAPLFDPSAVYFYGISQGHILGGTYLGISPVVERGILGVGGSDLTLMMFRARPFVAFLAFIEVVLPDKLDQQIVTTMMQLSFDRVDPLTYAPLVAQEPLPDGPGAKAVLLQIGIGDAQVPNVASHLHARALGIPLLEPAVRPIAGLETSASPAASALVEFDFGVDPLPGVQAIPPEGDNEVHEGVRRLEAAKEQLDRFFRPGAEVEHTCDGVCDPE
jgi:hypothetical protein